jgi:uncharacterized membrane protein YeaQ/YmgE (transglycosylase-associated protein family)
MPAPSWFLLVWSGSAATCVAALAGALVGGSAPATWSLLPRHRSNVRSLAATALAGAVIYPLIYGIVFETLGRADATLGLIMGAGHATVAAAFADPLRTPRVALRVAFMHFLYAVGLAFLYVTP